MSPNKLLRYAILGLIALSVLVAAEPTPAPPAAPDAPPTPLATAPNEMKISVVAILATDQCDKIDERVACIARAVRKDNPKLTGFQVHKMMCQSLPVGDTVTFKVIADQTVVVSVDRACTPDERMQMKIEPPGLGEITYETCCGKFMPFITRYRTPDNQVLIIAVRVQPCKCSK